MYTPLDVKQLRDLWAINPLAASKRYQTEGVEITGYLSGMSERSLGSYLIEVKAETRSTHIVTVVVSSRETKETLLKCSVGKRVVLRGRSDGKLTQDPALIADSLRPAE